MRKLSATMMAAMLLFLAVLQPLAVSAAGTPNFTLTSGNVAAGENVTVTVALDGSQTHVGGLHFYLEFDSNVLAYVSGSRTVTVDGISDDDLGSDVAVGNKIHFVWEGNRNKGVTIQDVIATYQFKLNKNVSSEVTATEVKLTVRSFFKDDVAMTDFIYSNIIVTKSIQIVDSEVKDVEEAISNIGTVVLNDACKQRIDEARNAYNALPADKRELVSNSNVLFQAEKEYAALQNSSASSAIQAEAAAFRNKYTAILGKTVEELELSDKAAVENAIEEWTSMSMEARAETIAEKRLLNKFEIRLTALQAESDSMEDAEEIAKSIRTTYAGVFAISEDASNALLLASEDVIEKILKEIEDNSLYNKYVNIVMESDIRFLQGLLSKIAQIPSSEKKNEEALAFEDEFGWIVNLTENGVQKSDLADVQTALYAYSKLSDEAKAALPGVEDHLNALSAAILALPDEQGEGTTEYVEIPGQTVYVQVGEETVNQEEGFKKVAVNLLGYSINPLVWWMMGFAGFMILIFVTEMILYYYLMNGKKKKEVAIG